MCREARRAHCAGALWAERYAADKRKAAAAANRALALLVARYYNEYRALYKVGKSLQNVAAVAEIRDLDERRKAQKKIDRHAASYAKSKLREKYNARYKQLYESAKKES